ncbi:MAG: transposase [Chlorobi bacterium]|nr:transposase [Chlorobiota bacterium]
MKKTRLTESQIIRILGEQEAGRRVAEICPSHGISQPTTH